ncbi:arginine deiminase family protein [Pseudovibrio sp. Tun.PSC04-5.I4]|uniref:arginine deiminase family protein n=1 Tax=Pseudovibrio sp. Tun.PSC04-5.I4 TaxID=1798213 RepID=UPI00088E4F3B|nr:arginine deiminase family protein [Pseudovibrio sp. Tun.PSC04-5.I4]SDR33725.1 dimethylargininase [Pseudovibrio sp. Tun.PSC04-5.I4]
MNTDVKVYNFNNAILRRPSKSVVNGLRDDDRGNPTYEGVLAEHDAYITAMEAAGVNLHVLPAMEEFPDSIFVEDPALVFTEGAILLRPGTATREGETVAIAKDIRKLFDTVLEIDAGYVDGGDILNTPEAVMIGLSARTTREGAEALIKCLAQIGRKGVIVETPANVLHFKSDCSLLDDNTMLSTKRLSVSGVFEGLNVLHTPDGEEGAANALRVNDVVFVGSDFPQTIKMLQEAGYSVVPLATSQIAKIDAGLSCMSLRYFKK